MAAAYFTLVRDRSRVRGFVTYKSCACRQHHLLKGAATTYPIGSLVRALPDVQTTQKHVHLTARRPSEQATGAHGKHWVAERMVAASLIGIIPAAYFIQHPAMEFALTASLVLHAHWGIQGLFGDYMHGYPGPSGERKHPWLAKLGVVLSYILSITAFACLLSFNYNDVGLQKAISMLWKL